MSSEFPTSIRLTREAVERDFFVVSDTRAGNERLHYRVTVPKHWKVLDTASGNLSEEQQVASLGTLRSMYAPHAELQVDVVYLKREIDPADWLDLMLEGTEDKVLHSRKISSPAGDIPDVLTMRTLDNKTTIHRWVAVKNGSSMLLAQARCYREDYPTLADTFFIAASSVAFLHPRGWPLSERLSTFSRAEPFDFMFAYPETWKLQLDPDSSEGALSLNLINIADKYVVGTVVVLAARAEHAPAELLHDRVWGELKARGYSGELPSFSETTPMPAMAPRFELIAQILRREAPHELRMSVAIVAATTLLVAVVGPARGTAGNAWAVNKRAYQLVLEHLTTKQLGAT